MALTVVVRSGDLASLPHITFDAPRIVIGRGDGCEVRLPDPSISHRHASIRQRGPDYIVVDEGSTNGTFVGPVRLSPQSPRMLRSGDLVRVGRIWLEVRFEQVLPTQNPQVITREIALALVAGALKASGEASGVRVSVTAGPDAGKELTLDAFDVPHAIGRDPKAALSVQDPDASRRHVELTRRGDKLWVRDLNSKNGSRLDDQALPADKEVPWPTSAELKVGANSFSYDDPVAAVLDELERAADERMRADESVDPPAVEGQPRSETPPPTSDDGTPHPLPLESSSAAPIAEVPKQKQPKKPAAPKPGWTSAEFVILALAVFVLVLSALGLFWLFRVE